MQHGRAFGKMEIKAVTQVDRLMVEGERHLGYFKLQPWSPLTPPEAGQPSVFSLNTCVVISQSFEKNMDNGGSEINERGN